MEELRKEELRKEVVGRNGMVMRLMRITIEMPEESRRDMYKAILDLKTAFCNGLKKMN